MTRYDFDYDAPMISPAFGPRRPLRSRRWGRGRYRPGRPRRGFAPPGLPYDVYEAAYGAEDAEVLSGDPFDDRARHTPFRIMRGRWGERPRTWTTPEEYGAEYRRTAGPAYGGSYRGGPAVQPPADYRWRRGESAVRRGPPSYDQAFGAQYGGEYGGWPRGVAPAGYGADYRGEGRAEEPWGRGGRKGRRGWSAGRGSRRDDAYGGYHAPYLPARREWW